MIMNVKYKLSIPSILALFTLVAFTSTVNGQNKPNVVIMLGDNVGYGDIGAYGAGEVRGIAKPRRLIHSVFMSVSHTATILLGQLRSSQGNRALVTMVMRSWKRMVCVAEVVQPLKPFFDKSWKAGEIEVVK